MTSCLSVAGWDDNMMSNGSRMDRWGRRTSLSLTTKLGAPLGSPSAHQRWWSGDRQSTRWGTSRPWRPSKRADRSSWRSSLPRGLIRDVLFFERLGCSAALKWQRLLCSGATGRTVKVPTGGDIVWAFITPVVSGEVVAQGTTREAVEARRGGAGDPISRASNCPLDYHAFIGQQWVPRGLVEGDEM